MRRRAIKRQEVDPRDPCGVGRVDQSRRPVRRDVPGVDLVERSAEPRDAVAVTLSDHDVVVGVVGGAQEDEPVARRSEPGPDILLRAADQQPGGRPWRFARVDVAVLRVDDRAVLRHPEGRRDMPLGPDRHGDERDRRARSRRAARIAGRTGSVGRNSGRRCTSAMGSHLSGKVQAGRCRMRAVCGQDVISIVGRGSQVQVVEEQVGQVALEAAIGGHADRPPGTGSRPGCPARRRPSIRIAASA